MKRTMRTYRTPRLRGLSIKKELGLMASLSVCTFPNSRYPRCYGCVVGLSRAGNCRRENRSQEQEGRRAGLNQGGAGAEAVSVSAIPKGTAFEIPDASRCARSQILQGEHLRQPRKHPSPAIVPPAPSPLGEGFNFFGGDARPPAPQGREKQFVGGGPDLWSPYMPDRGTYAGPARK